MSPLLVESSEVQKATVVRGTALVEEAENRLFSAVDSVCLERATLVSEAYERFALEPVPIRRARAFEHVLRHMSLDLMSNPLFAGNTSSRPRAWMLVPEFGLGMDPQVEIEHEELRGFLRERIPDDIRSYWRNRSVGGNGGVGHMSLDFSVVVNEGLEAVVRRVDASASASGSEFAGAGPANTGIYREAMTISCRAVIDWAQRYAGEADMLASSCADTEAARCLRRVAAACRHVPAHPARNLFEGLQSIVLVHLASVVEGQGVSMSIGLPDRALQSFAAEVDEDPEKAVTLTRAFLLKVAANSYHGRGSKTQAITVGGAAYRAACDNGQDDGARDACNPVTSVFLEAFDRTPVSDPHLFLRWHRGLDERCMDKALKMLSRGRSMPLLVNDHAVMPGLLGAGVTPPDAWDYCIVGCNELGIPGRCCQSGFSVGLGFNDLELVDSVMRSLDPASADTGAILDGYEQAVKTLTRVGLGRRMDWVRRTVATVPFPFCSACCRSCAETGEDYLVGLPYSHIYGLFIRGTSNAANALAAFQDIVNGRGGTDPTRLLKGIDERDPRILRAIERAPKWGSDDDRADRLAVELNARRDRALRAVAMQAGVRPFAVCHVVRSLHHLDGLRIGNTADGRPAGGPVGDSIGAVAGTVTAGPTALLNSVLKLDAARCFTGIYNLNLTLPGGSQSAPTILRGLTEGFLRSGGQELQIGVLDADELERARETPDRYRDLVVRVAGLNARFVELSRLEQEELIRRAKAASGQDSAG